MTREEAILDLEVQHVSAPLLYLDVTVRHGVPGDAALLRAAASSDGAIASRGEGDKRRRYPSDGVPFKCVPLAAETYGRLGSAALKHLRWLAKGYASAASESGIGGEWPVHAQMQRWGALLSVALQKANARNLRSAVGLSGPPSGYGASLEELLRDAWDEG